MTVDILFISLALLGGALLGIFYFGTLWLAVKRLPDSRYPVLIVIGGFFLRLSITILGFYLIFGGSWERLVVCLIGFIVARTILIRMLGPSGIKTPVKGGIGSADNT